MSEFKPVLVPCPSCGETYLETTEEYDPAKMTNGRMLRLTEKYGPDGLNWSCFPYDEWILGDALECPGCGAPMGGLQGMVNVNMERGGLEMAPALVHTQDDAGSSPAPATNTSDAHVCPECGKACKNAQGLVQHTKLKHGGQNGNN